MTLERRNPLPPGRYWQDVFAPNDRVFTAWRELNRSKVKVVSTEHFEANAGGPARDFVVFEVTDPVNWPATQLGFPTVAGATVTTSDDTVSKPPPEKDLVDTLNPSALLGGGSLALVGIGAAGLALALALVLGGRRQ